MSTEDLRSAATMAKTKFLQCRQRTSQVCKTVRDELNWDMPPIEICDAISVCEWKLDLMAKMIFDQVWVDQKEAILQACQMLDACDKAVEKSNRDQYQTLTNKTKSIYSRSKRHLLQWWIFWVPKSIWR